MENKEVEAAEGLSTTHRADPPPRQPQRYGTALTDALLLRYSHAEARQEGALLAENPPPLSVRAYLVLKHLLARSTTLP